MIKSNRQIGLEIKRIRGTLGMSQMKLAEEVGVSFQQIQKYEKGISRISVERIQQIANILGTSVLAFFEKEKVSMVAESLEKYSPKKEVKKTSSLSLNPEEIVLLHLFRKIDNRKIREGLIRQLRGIIELKKLER